MPPFVPLEWSSGLQPNPFHFHQPGVRQSTRLSCMWCRHSAACRDSRPSIQPGLWGAAPRIPPPADLLPAVQGAQSLLLDRQDAHHSGHAKRITDEPPGSAHLELLDSFLPCRFSATLVQLLNCLPLVWRECRC